MAEYDQYRPHWHDVIFKEAEDRNISPEALCKEFLLTKQTYKVYRPQDLDHAVKNLLALSSVPEQLENLVNGLIEKLEARLSEEQAEEAREETREELALSA